MATITTYNLDHNFVTDGDKVLLSPGLSGVNSFSITFEYSANSDALIKYYWANQTGSDEIMVPLTDASGNLVTTDLLAANTTAGIQVTNFFGEKIFLEVLRQSATSGTIDKIIIKTY